MHRDAITAALVARLVAEQFPAWADLPVVPVAESGWDNRTFRVGDTLTARLPTAEWYVAAVAKEHTWLPHLAPHLPLPVPEPVALGSPGSGYPWPWSVRRWIDGRPAIDDRIADPVDFARDLARFLVALWGVDPAGGPAAGAHSFHRGGALAVYDDETRAALATLETQIDQLDRAAATRMWADAMAAEWTGAPVWFHGDVAEGNLLVDGPGRLCAVIDFGTSGVGDPACDLVQAWTLFDGASRAAFVEDVGWDVPTWARARGWALWKALITWAAPDAAPRHVDDARRTLARLLDSDNVGGARRSRRGHGHDAWRCDHGGAVHGQTVGLLIGAVGNLTPKIAASGTSGVRRGAWCAFRDDHQTVLVSRRSLRGAGRRGRRGRSRRAARPADRGRGRCGRTASTGRRRWPRGR